MKDYAVSLLALFFLFVSKSSAYFVTLDAHAEECFFDKVVAGTKLGNFILKTQQMTLTKVDCIPFSNRVNV